MTEVWFNSTVVTEVMILFSLNINYYGGNDIGLETHWYPTDFNFEKIISAAAGAVTRDELAVRSLVHDTHLLSHPASNQMGETRGEGEREGEGERREWGRPPIIYFIYKSYQILSTERVVPGIRRHNL